jgi:hypothetical protein
MSKCTKEFSHKGNVNGYFFAHTFQEPSSSPPLEAAQPIQLLMIDENTHAIAPSGSAVPVRRAFPRHQGRWCLFLEVVIGDSRASNCDVMKELT